MSVSTVEGIVINYRVSYLNEKEVFEIVVKYSPKNFYELKLHKPELIPEDLESFFISWKNRTSKKLLSLIIVNDSYRFGVEEESMKTIEKYKI